MSSTPAPQTNGVPAPSAGASSQTLQNTQSSFSIQTSQQPSQQPSQPQQQHHNAPLSPATTAPRPRDSRMIELLLVSQGVTSYESRVPLLLLDFAYRHTSSILNDAIHLSADPYTSHAGARPSAAAGAAAQSLAGAAGADATVSANAVRLAISARLGYQYRGGSGSAGVSKEWMQELSRERNKQALPKVAPSEWGVRLPSERFVLTGVSWGLRDFWADARTDDDSDDQAEEDEDEMVLVGHGSAMEGVEASGVDAGGDGVEGGTMEDVFGGEAMDEDLDGQ